MTLDDDWIDRTRHVDVRATETRRQKEPQGRPEAPEHRPEASPGRPKAQPPLRRAAAATVSILSVRPVLGWLAAKGQDLAPILVQHGLSPALLADPEARIAHDRAAALWKQAAQLTGARDLGLQIAEAIRPGQFGAIDHAARTSTTLGSGYGRMFRYYRVLHDLARTAMEMGPRHVVLSHDLPLPGGAPRAVSEFVLAAWLVTGRQATGVDWTPVEVRFAHGEPADTARHQRLFGAPLRFNHARSELVIDAGLMALPLLRADASLQPIVEAQLQMIHQRVPGESRLGSRRETQGETQRESCRDEIVDAVQRLIRDRLCDGEPTLAAIAGQIHVSARTLNRRLADEGTTFRDLLTEVRRSLAQAHLAAGRLAIAEIAFLLGFSEASAFHRAFRRWTGVTPAAWRSAAARTPLPGSSPRPDAS